SRILRDLRLDLRLPNVWVRSAPGSLPRFPTPDILWGNTGRLRASSHLRGNRGTTNTRVSRAAPTDVRPTASSSHVGDVVCPAHRGLCRAVLYVRTGEIRPASDGARRAAGARRNGGGAIAGLSVAHPVAPGVHAAGPGAPTAPGTGAGGHRRFGGPLHRGRSTGASDGAR